MSRKRSAGQSGMKRDIKGGTWLSGWGKDNPIQRRQDRAIRKRLARKEIREERA